MGSLLILAAALKLQDGLARPAGNTAWAIAQIQAQWLLGVWLLSGLWSRLGCAAAVAAFGLFAAVSLYRGIDGQNDCGCFGAWSVSPWVTAALDLVVLVALAACFPSVRERSPQPNRAYTVAVAAVALVGGLWSGVALAAARPATIAEDGSIVGEARSVVIEAGAWEGKPFPLLAHADIGEELRGGRWRVLLYRHDCPACQAELTNLIGEAKDNKESRLAAIELPPYAQRSDRPRLAAAGIKHGRLSDRYDWVVQTPVSWELRDGTVVPSRAEASTTVVSQETPQTQPAPQVEPAITERSEALEHDFGYVEPGETRRVLFAVRNTTAADWTLGAPKIECDCTEVVNFPASIPAGQSGEVVIDFTAPPEASEYAKRVFLMSIHTREPVVTLKVRAAIGQALAWEPRELDLEALAKEGEARITVTNRGSKPVKLLYSTSQLPGVVAVVPRDPVPPGGTLQLVLKAKPGALNAPRGKVQIHTAVKEQPVLEVELN